MAVNSHPLDSLRWLFNLHRGPKTATAVYIQILSDPTQRLFRDRALVIGMTAAAYSIALGRLKKEGLIDRKRIGEKVIIHPSRGYAPVSFNLDDYTWLFDLHQGPKTKTFAYLWLSLLQEERFTMSELGQGLGIVPSGAIAAAKQLAEEGLIDYSQYRGVCYLNRIETQLPEEEEPLRPTKNFSELSRIEQWEFNQTRGPELTPSNEVVILTRRERWMLEYRQSQASKRIRDSHALCFN